ncbi:hypothetical protein AJ87_10165 [Rhizobium yanglingense]|nr:hypothetical protein AJ87_10165 [Rhizobium yanglingense]
MFAQVETAFRPRWRVKTILEHTSIAARIYRSFSPNGNGFFGAEPSPGQDGSAGYFAGKRRMRDKESICDGLCVVSLRKEVVFARQMPL